MRLIPSSLTTRLFLILLFGLLFAQIIGGFIIFKDRGEVMRTSRENGLSQHIVMTIKTFDAVTPNQYPKLLLSFNQPGFEITLTDQPEYIQQRNDNFFLHHVRRILKRQLGRDRKIHLMPPPEWEHHRINQEHPPFMASNMPLMLSTPLQDGRWLNINTTLEHIDSWGSNLFASLIFVFVMIAVIAFIAVRSVTRPLSTLAKAVDQFGHNREIALLPETGPREVAESARAFNRMQQQISSHLKEREEMLAAVSHDLRTPLTRMKLRLELHDDPVLLEKMNEDIDEMELMITSTLDYMRGIASDEPITRISVNQTCEEIVDGFRLKGESVSFKPHGDVFIQGRPVSIKRCISNIVDNGLKYGKQVEIAITDQPEQVLISVCDNGPGIPADQIDSVFSPFTRIDKSRNRTTGGTGLGLGIARTIARNNGGDIAISNRSEGGLEVIITLSKNSG